MKREKKRKMEKKKKRKEKEKKRKQTKLHYCTLLLKEFLLFSIMPISIETVMPIRTTIAICLIISLAIYALENMRIWLTHIGSHTIRFLVFHIAPCFFSVVFSFMSSIALSISGDIRVTT